MTRLEQIAQGDGPWQHDPARWASLCARFSTLEDLLITRCTTGWSTTSNAGVEEALLEEELLCSRAPPVLTGQQLYISLRDTRRSLPTGCTGIDALLGNGVLEGCVLEVAGGSATGKTQLCHSMAASTAGRGEGCVYIDTTNSFSTQRLMQMLGPGVQPEQALECITVFQVHSVHHLLDVLDELAVQLSQEAQAATQQPPSTSAGCHISSEVQMTPPSSGPASGTTAAGGSSRAGGRCSRAAAPLFTTRPAVLLLDSISAVISPILGSAQHSQGHVLMLSAARVLKALADTYNIAVVMTNHVTARKGGGGQGWGEAPAQGPAGQLVPALGEGWRSQPHMRLQLHLGPDPSAPRTATLTHTSLKAAGESVQFRITAGGLEDC